MDLAEAVFAVIIIGVDDAKRRVDQPFGRQNSLAGAPGLGAALRQGAGDVAQVLEGVVHRHAMGGADRRDAVPNGLAELSLDVPADHKNDVVETRLDGVMDGIIHDDVATGIHRLQLLDAAAKARSDTGGHDEQSCVHTFPFLCFSVTPRT